MSSRKQKLEASLEGLFSVPKARPPSKVGVPAGEKKRKPPAKDIEDEKTPAQVLGESAVVPEIIPPETEKPVVIAQDVPKAPIVPEVRTPRAEPPAPIGDTAGPVTIAEKTPPSQVAVRPTREVIPITEESRAGIELKIVDEGLQIVTFRLNNNYYGVDIAAVQTIIKPQAVCPVPFTAPYIEGLTNLRGQIVPVIDLRKRMSLPVVDIDKDTRIIIVSILNEWAGIRVDEVTGVTRLPSEAIEPAAHMVSSSDIGLLSGIAKKDKDLILILDIPAVFAVNERAIHHKTKSVLENYD